MRYLIGVLLVLTFGVLNSCAGEAASDSQKVELSIWQGFNTEETQVFRQILSDFETQWEEENGKDLVVIDQFVSFGDMFTKLRTSAMANITPDIAFMDSIKVTDLAFGRALVRLDELETFKQRYGSLEGARKEFVSASFNAGVINRRGEVGLYGLPVQTTTVALFWNREMFREQAEELRQAGLDPNRAPKDWEELVAYGKVLTDKEREIHGFGMHGSLWFNFPFFNMYEVGFIKYDEDGTASPDLNTPEGIAALERIQSLANSGIEGGAWKRSALSPDAGFINRKYAMVMTGPWNVENFTNAGLDFDISLIPGPSEEEIERLGLQPAEPGLVEELGQLAYTSSNVGGQTGIIMRSCENREVAFEFLDYFTSERVQRRWASELGQIPVRLAAWEKLDTTKYPFMPKFMQQLRTARRIPQIPLYGVLESNIFNPQIDLLLQNSQTPEEMMERMEAAMKREILVKINRGEEPENPAESEEREKKEVSYTFSHGGVIRAPRNEKELVLIFTGGDFADGIDVVLDTLQEQDVPGSFFFTGDFINEPDNESALRRLVDAGHYLGPHSDKHLLYCPWDDRSKTLVTKEEFTNDLDKNIADLERFGVSPQDVTWWIPPYEWYNEQIVEWSEEAGRRLFNFTPGTLSHADYTEDDADNYRGNDEIYRSILEFEAKEPDGLNGFLLLTHVGSSPKRTEKFYNRLDSLITELKSRGYGFTTVDQLLRGAPPRS